LLRELRKKDAYGCSIDFYKFSEKSSGIFFKEIEKIIEEDGNLKDWTEVAMQNLFKKQSLSFEAIDITGMSWVEIDNYEDLAQSDAVFSQLKKRITDYKHYCFDLDGTAYVGAEAVRGVV